MDCSQYKQAVEREQRRCIGLANEDKSLLSLECRINDTDISETYKFLNDDCRLKSENFVQTNVNHLRGHSNKLLKPQSDIDHHKFRYKQNCGTNCVYPYPFKFPY